MRSRRRTLAQSLTPAVRLKVFHEMLHQARIVQPVPEYRFHATRMWRFDFAWPACKVALEVEGGIWTRGRHTRGAGVLKDMEKYNAAATEGWRLLRVTPTQLATAETVTLIEDAIAYRDAA